MLGFTGLCVTIIVPVFLEEYQVFFVSFETQRLQTLAQFVDCDVPLVVVVLAVEDLPQNCKINRRRKIKKNRKKGKSKRDPLYSVVKGVKCWVYISTRLKSNYGSNSDTVCRLSVNYSLAHAGFADFADKYSLTFLRACLLYSIRTQHYFVS